MNNNIYKIISSKIRVRLLGLFLKNPQKTFFQKELIGNDTLSAVQRELKNLERAQIIVKNYVGRYATYSTNTKSEFYKGLKYLFSFSESSPKKGVKKKG